MKKTNIKKFIAFAFVGVFSLGLCLIPLFNTNKVSASNFDYNGNLIYSYMHDVDVIYNYTYNDNYFNYSSTSSSKVSASGVFDNNGSINMDGSTSGYPNYRTLDYLSYYDGYDTYAPKQVPLVGYGYTLNSNNIEETIYFHNTNNLNVNYVVISFNDLVSIGDFYSFFNSIKFTRNSTFEYCNIIFTYFSEFDGKYIKKELTVPILRDTDGMFHLEDFSDLITDEWYDFFNYNNTTLYYYKNVTFNFSSSIGSFCCNTYNTNNGFITGATYNSLLNAYNGLFKDYYYYGGWDKGKLEGLEEGKLEGLEEGYNNAMRDTKPFDVIINTVESFLNLEIFPDFHVYYLFMISIGVMTVGLVMKLLLGG